MNEIKLSWTDFKAMVSAKGLSMQYVMKGKDYYIWASEKSDKYCCYIFKEVTAPDPSDQKDFEDNYKSDANKALQLLADDNRPVVRVESRPTGMTLAWTGRGDSATTIAEGKVLSWDFSNTDDEVTAPTDFKRKRIEFDFIESVRVKDGLLFSDSAPWGCYVDFYVVCPNGEYYIKDDGTPALATEDTIVSHYVVHNMLHGTVNIGITYNSESCTDPIPPNYKFWCEVTTPDTDSTSKGSIRLELFRPRTVALD